MADPAPGGVRRRATASARDSAREERGKGRSGLIPGAEEATPGELPVDTDAGAAAAAGRETRREGAGNGGGEAEKGKRKGNRAPPPQRQGPPLTAWEMTSMAMTILTAVVTVSSTYFILQQWRTKPTPQVRTRDLAHRSTLLALSEGLGCINHVTHRCTQATP